MLRFRKNVVQGIAGFVLLSICHSSCTYYRVVSLYEIRDQNNREKKTILYAIAKNNIIVPEYVIDTNGLYPQTKEEAWNRFRVRKDTLETSIDKKYKIPHTVPYQMKRMGLMIGLIAVSPVVIPITYFSEITQKDTDGNDHAGFWDTVKEYFSLAANEPISYHPPLKDEFKIVPLRAR